MTSISMLLQEFSGAGLTPLAAAVQAAQGSSSDPAAQALAQGVSCCSFHAIRSLKQPARLAVSFHILMAHEVTLYSCRNGVVVR